MQEQVTKPCDKMRCDVCNTELVLFCPVCDVKEKREARTVMDDVVDSYERKEADRKKLESLKIEVVRLEVAKLEPRPGDVVVFRTTKDIALSIVHALRDHIQEAMPEGVKWLLFCGDIEIAVVEPEREKEVDSLIRQRDPVEHQLRVMDLPGVDECRS